MGFSFIGNLGYRNLGGFLGHASYGAKTNALPIVAVVVQVNTHAQARRENHRGE